MATVTTETLTAIEAVDASAYTIPTATERETDGTLEWDSTSVVVVEVRADGRVGVGYTYCHPSAAHGTLDPREGLLTPNRGRPGLGLELKRDEAQRYEVNQ